MTGHIVVPEDLEYYWPLAKAWLEPALERQGCDIDIDYVDAALSKGTAQLWVELHDGQIIAAGVTDITVTSKGPICTLLAVGGKKVDVWADRCDQVADWAETMGCIAIEGLGRRGWKAKIPKGWYESGVMYRKELK